MSLIHLNLLFTIVYVLYHTKSHLSRNLATSAVPLLRSSELSLYMVSLAVQYMLQLRNYLTHLFLLYIEHPLSSNFVKIEKKNDIAALF